MQHLLQEYEQHETLWEHIRTSVRNGQKFFILFGKKYYFTQN